MVYHLYLVLPVRDIHCYRCKFIIFCSDFNQSIVFFLKFDSFCGWLIKVNKSKALSFTDLWHENETDILDGKKNLY